MFKAVTSKQMKELDRLATERYGIRSLLLMENAGRGIAEFIYSLCRDGRVTIVAGKGNNGGDGFVIARHLFNRGYAVLVLLAAEPALLKGDAKENYEILVKMKIPQRIMTEETSLNEVAGYFEKSDMLVDALFGVGLSKPVTGFYAALIEAMNRHKGIMVAVDVPSGLNADNGQVMGVSVKATHTATLGLPKKGLMEALGPVHAGRVAVIDIGLPKVLLNQASPKDGSET